MKQAIIVGNCGQDGRILFDRLSHDGYALLGIGRESLATCGTPFQGVLNILDAPAISAAVRQFQPDEVYYLAAYHHSSEDKSLANTRDLFARSHDVHVVGLLNFLEAIRTEQPRARLVYAASSHVFGDPATPTQDENTPLRPLCVYGITKTTGIHVCRMYRQSHGVGASAAILYNHESPYRRADFLSQRIVRGAVAIQQGQAQELVLGDLSARVDWGYAPDYVDAMVRILALPEASDFLVATGEPHTVAELAATAFAALGLDWRAHVREDPTLLARRRMELVGNSRLLREQTSWRPSVTFETMIGILLRAEQERCRTTPPAEK